METGGLFFSFLFLMTGLFFIPKLFRKLHIPEQVVEFFLGVAVALWFPFFHEHILEIVTVFATIGVITVFLFAGMEVDIGFITKHRQSMLLGAASQLLLLFGLAAVMAGLAFSGVVRLSSMAVPNLLLISLVLITPSAGFIVSMLNVTKLKARHKQHLVAHAISAEIIAIALLTVLLYLGNPARLSLMVGAVLLLIFLLPLSLEFIYLRLFKDLVNVEFPLFFVIALIAAFVTEMLGLHFIIGAFVAGLVIDLFMRMLVRDEAITSRRADRVMHGMSFLATLFVPFYFFSVGLRFTWAYFTWHYIVIAAVMAVAISFVRMASFSGFQVMRKGSFLNELRIGSVLLPTLMIGFILADLLHSQGRISDGTFAVLIWYAVFTSLTPLVTRQQIGEIRLER